MAAMASDDWTWPDDVAAALRALPELDGRYAVFGQVTKGMEVVDQLVQGDKLIKAVVVEGGTLVKDKP